VPSADGTTVCQLYTPPSDAQDTRLGGCALHFSKLGLLTGSQTATVSNAASASPRITAKMVFGIASDDVSRVAVELSGGTILDVDFVNGVFYWHAKLGQEAIAVHTWRGEVHARALVPEA
jgi:hypothetical protein